MQHPTIAQGMYIFKNKKVGGKYNPHKDGSFMTTTPQSVCGIWVALDDATLENGCLMGVPGSHLTPPNQHMRVRPIPEEENVEGMEAVMEPLEPTYQYSTEGAIPFEVKAGSIVLLHNQFIHFSKPNVSDKSRHAYTMHVVERADGYEYSEYNWIRRTNASICG